MVKQLKMISDKPMKTFIVRSKTTKCEKTTVEKCVQFCCFFHFFSFSLFFV